MLVAIFDLLDGLRKLLVKFRLFEILFCVVFMGILY